MGKVVSVTRMKYALLCLSVIGSLGLSAEEFAVDGVEFIYRAPSTHSPDSRIMILFGGRNWNGTKTLNTYRFESLAEKHKLFLLSPSFCDREYWNPDKWSGPALKKAVFELEKRYRLAPGKLYLYGYSAGGQCANLFYAWMPERIAAWGAHACGVFFVKEIREAVPALLTCGNEDRERFELSKLFLYRYRENGGRLLWKPYRGVGHELNAEALRLARAWFDAQLSGMRAMEFGEDDTGQIRRGIDPEYRNPLETPEIREYWKP